jgi:hypothetical protein
LNELLHWMKSHTTMEMLKMIAISMVAHQVHVPVPGNTRLVTFYNTSPACDTCKLCVSIYLERFCCLQIMESDITLSKGACIDNKLSSVYLYMFDIPNCFD